MNSDLLSWLGHPMTVNLLLALTGLLFATIEVMLRSLAEIGNVRFQGMIEDHAGLLPEIGDTRLHLSRLLDSLRWLELVSIGLFWLAVFQHPGITTGVALLLCAGLPVALVVVSRIVIGALDEDTVATLLRVIRPLMWPLVRMLARGGPAPPAPSDEDEDEEASEREIQAYLEAGHAAGIFEPDEREFVESLVEFFDTVVREVMTPRTEMVAVPIDATIPDVLATIARTHKSRIPVYEDTIDRVVGVVHVKNLVKHAGSEHPPELRRIMRECLVVPETKPLGELMRDFQRQHQQMAIVVDEYGGTSGMVTLEDAMEEIVGEIQDEHEPILPPESQEVSPGVYRLRGLAPLEVLQDLLQVKVEEEDVDTVGGLVFSRHGTVPEPGTRVVDDALGLSFTVDEMDGRRIAAVTVRRLADDTAPGDDRGARDQSDRV